MSRSSKKLPPIDPRLEAFIRALARDQAERDIRRIYGTREEVIPPDESEHPQDVRRRRGST
jgi:hypothetical protein